ncbi:von Willebrand factor type A domain-containing protein [Micromonospora sp. NPDC050417]|uniref:vWA domain-containing protein n=1 Tax=Micromonospora sp. NPDC050417 TaxID=3364280 RepID=UPI00379E3549
MASTRRSAPLAVLLGILALTVSTTLVGCSADSEDDHGSGRPPVSRGEDEDSQWPGKQGSSTEYDPESTFAVDVDTASYGYASRLLREGRWPERDKVRPEEFVNSFEQDYPEPGGDGFAVHIDGARPPTNHGTTVDDELRLMRVGLQTRSDEAENRPDAALTFVVDTSGSMAEPGRLDLVRDALHTLVDQLRRTESVAIVAFSGEARVVQEMTRVSDAERLHSAIDSLRPESFTNLEAGLVLGYQVAREGFRAGQTNRVIVLSDGLANSGEIGADAILRRVREEADKEIALLGVGVGSEYGDALMERLADRGDGFVVYVGDRTQAREVFVRQLPATLTVRALDAKVQVTFDPATVSSYRLVGYENRALADDDFRDDRVDGGEVGPGHSVTALYEVRLNGERPASARAAQVRVRWLDPQDRTAAETYESVTVGNLDGRFELASPRLWVCYAAGYFAEALRRIPAGEEIRLTDLRRVAERAAEQTGDPKVAELAMLIGQVA